MNWLGIAFEWLTWGIATLVVPFILWFLRVEKKMQRSELRFDRLEEQMQEARYERRKNEEKLEKVLDEHRQDLREIRADIKKLLGRSNVTDPEG